MCPACPECPGRPKEESFELEEACDYYCSGYFEQYCFRDCSKQDYPELDCPKPECPKLECPKPNCPKPNCPKPEVVCTRKCFSEIAWDRYQALDACIQACMHEDILGFHYKVPEPCPGCHCKQVPRVITKASDFIDGFVHLVQLAYYLIEELFVYLLSVFIDGNSLSLRVLVLETDP